METGSGCWVYTALVRRKLHFMQGSVEGRFEKYEYSKMKRILSLLPNGLGKWVDFDVISYQMYFSKLKTLKDSAISRAYSYVFA